MLHEVSFPSFNKRDEVHGWIYTPACEPKGIVQLIHGFGEHSRRYLHLISALVDAGYIVAADDHVGHGKTAIENNESWGDWGDEGYETMREDEHSLMQLVKEMYPNLPYFVYGHSMGSFIARDLAANYGDEIDGMTICGTSGTWPNLDETIGAVKQIVDAGKGKEADQALMGQALGWMFGRCESAAIGNEWICHDSYVQLDHAKDPFNAFSKPTCNQSLLYFMQMIDVITGPEWAAKIPADLPIYNIAGDEDPVGQYGRGVYEVTNWLYDTGHKNVRTIVYPGYRHEIHNYSDLKDDVAEGIIEFFDDITEE